MTDAAGGPGDPVIDVTDLSVTLGETRVLDSVSLSVDSGEFVGLIGPNGAGKTTLLRTIRATLAPDSGVVTVAGEDIHARAAKAASRLVASVPQDTALAFDFSVREAVEMGRTPHLSRFSPMTDADRDAVDRAMARTAVTELAERPVTQISGGERSRVLLARALAQETPVLLLDEPTASLDVNHQVRTLDLVADLVAEGRTAVAAIHDLDMAARYCDRLVVVADGRILDCGRPESVLTADVLRAAFDTETAVTTDPVTESPRVTALSGRGETADPATEEAAPDRIHVVAGGGRSGPLLTRLANSDLSVTVGPVADGDTDAEVAEAFGMERLLVDPLSGVDEATRARVRDAVAAADAVVVGDVDLTPGIRPVLDVVAGERVPTVCVTDRPLAERAVDEAATTAYRSLQSHGSACATGRVVDALRALGPVTELRPGNSD